MSACMDDHIKLDYLNGLLSENERNRVEKHLAGCPDCCKEFDDLRVIRASLAGLPRFAAPEAWGTAAKARLREASARAPQPLPSRIPFRVRTDIFQYALIAAGVTAAAGLFVWLFVGGVIQRLLPGLSTADLGISDPRAARTVEIVALVLSLHALLLIPSIIENIYQLVRRRGRRAPPATTIRSFTY